MNKPKVLIACEESQRVCTAMRDIGIEAYSCDILPCSGGHPEWHIHGDVQAVLQGGCYFQTMDGFLHNVEGEWDMIIAHPPCTYLSAVATRHLYPNGELNIDRFEKGVEAAKFFILILNTNCKRIAVENPVQFKIFNLPKYTQIIHPYQFGDPYDKRTCLWLKNLPNLKPTKIVECTNNCSQKAGEAGKSWYTQGGKDRQKIVLKHFPVLPRPWQNNGEGCY